MLAQIKCLFLGHDWIHSYTTGLVWKEGLCRRCGRRFGA